MSVSGARPVHNELLAREPSNDCGSHNDHDDRRYPEADLHPPDELRFRRGEQVLQLGKSVLQIVDAGSGGNESAEGPNASSCSFGDLSRVWWEKGERRFHATAIVRTEDRPEYGNADRPADFSSWRQFTRAWPQSPRPKALSRIKPPTG